MRSKAFRFWGLRRRIECSCQSLGPSFVQLWRNHRWGVRAYPTFCLVVVCLIIRCDEKTFPTKWLAETFIRGAKAQKNILVLKKYKMQLFLLHDIHFLFHDKQQLKKKYIYKCANRCTKASVDRLKKEMCRTHSCFFLCNSQLSSTLLN